MGQSESSDGVKREAPSDMYHALHDAAILVTFTDFAKLWNEKYIYLDKNTILYNSLG